jgi:hypothetical protein
VADDTGTRGETVDEILFLDQVEDPPELGFVRLVNGEFKFVDSLGMFNPRTGGDSDLLGRAIFKVDGGMIYSTVGAVLIKVSQ